MNSDADWFWSRVDMALEPDGCWRWTGRRHRFGYGLLDCDGAPRYAHRIAWALVHGEIEPGIHIVRRCRERACVRPEHLFAATRAEAGRYMAEQSLVATGERHGSQLYPERWACGERQGAAKLTDERVETIRQRYAAGESSKHLATKYGVSREYIWRIVSGQSRRPVPTSLPGPSRQ